MTEISSLREKTRTVRHERNERINSIIQELVLKNQRLVHMISGILIDKDDAGAYSKIIDQLPNLVAIAKDDVEKDLLLQILALQEPVNAAVLNTQAHI